MELTGPTPSYTLTAAPQLGSVASRNLPSSSACILKPPTTLDRTPKSPVLPLLTAILSVKSYIDGQNLSMA